MYLYLRSLSTSKDVISFSMLMGVYPRGTEGSVREASLPPLCFTLPGVAIIVSYASTILDVTIDKQQYV